MYTKKIRIFAFAISVLVLISSIYGIAFYFQWKMRQPQSVAELAAIQNAALNNPQKIASRIEKAKRLRELWKPTALKYKDEIRNMLKAGASEQHLQDKVFERLPTMLHYENQALADALDSGGDPFTWQAISKSQGKTKDQKQIELRKKGRDSTKFLLDEAFKSHKDIILSQSMNTGTHRVFLWASGRVTTSQSKIEDKGSYSALTRGTHQEVFPPFEEIGR